MANSMGDNVIRKTRVYSEVLGKFVELHKLSYPDFKEKILDGITLDEMESEVYIDIVIENMLVNPALRATVSEINQTAFRAEMFALICEDHPFANLKNIKEVIEEDPHPQYVKSMPNARSRVAYKKLIENVRKRMYANIIGQREAIDICIDSLTRGLIRKPDDKRPMACLMFAGLSGVGKSEVAKQLALALRDGAPEALVKIDCAEFSESHYLARLTGAPSGYVGYDDAGLFEHKIDGAPQVLLFDEFEKAHPKLRTMLLAIMEDGIVTMGNNVEISLSECIIILTSNLGSSEITRSWAGGMGFNPSTGYKKESVRRIIEKDMPVEFINRLDEIIIFDELTADEKRQIANLKMKDVAGRYSHLVNVMWTPAAEEWLVEDPKRSEGARAIRKKQDVILSAIAKEIVSKPKVKVMTVTVEGGKPLVKYEGAQ